MKIGFKAWNSPVEYTSRLCKHDIKESEGNMANPILNENVQGWKHRGSCAFAEPELLSYRNPKLLVQNEKNDHNNNSYNNHDEHQDEIEPMSHDTYIHIIIYRKLDYSTETK